MGERLVVPEYGGPNVCNIVPALLEPTDAAPSWMPAAASAEQIVLLVLDGLGWSQLRDRLALVPTLAAMPGQSITTVAPSTTATALTSITTGLPPGEHGVVGYRMRVDGDEVLNVLRWATPNGDARVRLPPGAVQYHEAFVSQRPPVVTKSDFARSGFTMAHLQGCRFQGYRMPSSLVAEVSELMRTGESFVYAYYDGIDKVAHEHGFGLHYDSELVAADHLVEQLVDALPRGCGLIITSDHGQVHVGDRAIELEAEVRTHVAFQSGEGRFRWLHARPGRVDALVEATSSRYSEVAWVRTRDEVVSEGWLGPHVSDEAMSRLGDVALVARADVAFFDPADTGPYELVGRHGALTAAEMYVPLLGTTIP